MTQNISSPQISLRINGTKERRAGFASLMPVGVLFTNDELKGLDRVTMVKETPVFVIRHSPDHILYMLVDRHVKSFDADAPGVLTIAVSVPKGYQLPGGQSPLNLLRELYETFKAENMAPLADGFMKYLNREANENTYRGILNRYQPLEPSTIPYVTMNPQGPTATLRVAPDKLEEFLSNTNYNEFRPYRDIEIGVACASTPELENLEIPRRVEYRVEVNGQVVPGVKLSRVTDSYTTNLSNDPDLYDFTNIGFNLQELIDNGGHLEKKGGVVTLDERASMIRCTVPVKRRQQLLKVQLIGASDDIATVREAMSGKHVTIQVDYKNCNRDLLNGNMSMMVDTQTNAHRVVITPERINNLKLEKALIKEMEDINGRYLLQRIVVTPVAQPTPVKTPPAPGGAGGGGGGGNVNGPRGMNVNITTDNIHTSDYDDTVRESSHSPNVNNRLLLAACAFVGLIVGAVAMYFLAPLLADKKDSENTAAKIEDMRSENQRLQLVNDSLAIELSLLQQQNDERMAAAAAEQAREAELKQAQEAKETEAQARAKANQAAAEATAAARTAILRLVNSGAGISSVRADNNWKKLSNSDQLAVESVLNLAQYKKKKNEVGQLLQTKYAGGVFASWNELQAARKDIIAIVGN